MSKEWLTGGKSISQNGHTFRWDCVGMVHFELLSINFLITAIIFSLQLECFNTPLKEKSFSLISHIGGCSTLIIH